MKSRQSEPLERPSTTQLEAELARVKYADRYRRVLRGTVCTLITVAAIAILVATLWLPVLQIYGNSMTPTLQNGDVVFSVKTSQPKTGDIVAFYYNNKILVKRVICGPGDWIDIDEDGTVYVNNEPLDEPYLQEKALGDCNLDPADAGAGRPPVRHGRSPLHLRGFAQYGGGLVADEQIVGKIVLRVWPLNRLGAIR